MAQDLGRQVYPLHVRSHQAMRANRFGASGAAGIDVQQEIVGQAPIAATRHASPVAGGECAVQHLQAGALGGCQPVSPRSGVQVNGAGLGADLAQRAAGVLHRHAARRHAFVGSLPGAGTLDADALHRDVEFFGSDLRQRGANALSQIDFPGTHRHLTIGMHAQPLRQAAVRLQAARQRHRIQTHAPVPAARNTARTIRLWAPQRHRCGSSASRTCASCGCGHLASKAAALIRMPDRQ